MGTRRPALEDRVIEVSVTRKDFGETPVLRDVHFSVAPGESLAIIGPSGVGKSTLLRIACGLDRDFAGEVRASGRIGIVFQEPTLLAWRPVLANLALMHPALGQHTLLDMLDRVGLSDKRDHWPGQLSLGQQRRLALARAFLGRPDFLVMDEPFTSLDPELHADMIALTQSLMQEFAPAVLLVTHDRSEAAALGQRVFALRGAPASLQEIA